MVTQHMVSVDGKSYPTTLTSPTTATAVIPKLTVAGTSQVMMSNGAYATANQTLTFT